MTRKHGWATCRPDTRHHYGSAFRRIRKRLLAGDPDCAICGERPAKIADHRHPICLGGETSEANLQAICAPCSLTKTGREGATMRAAKRRSRQQREAGRGAPSIPTPPVSRTDPEPPFTR